MNESSAANAVFQHRPKESVGYSQSTAIPTRPKSPSWGSTPCSIAGRESAGIVAPHRQGPQIQEPPRHGPGLAGLQRRLARQAPPARAPSATSAIPPPAPARWKTPSPSSSTARAGRSPSATTAISSTRTCSRDELEREGAIFKTTVDSEVILHLMAQPSTSFGVSSLEQALGKVTGAFSLVLLSEREVIGVRDSFGFRPLCIGKVGDAWLLSSESCAFEIIPGAKFLRDVEPGEVVVIDENGLRSIKPWVPKSRLGFCIFEYVYFARPDSNLEGVNVSAVRTNMGRELARLWPVEAELIVPVPDSGNYAALGFSEESGIPYDAAFVRNHYVGRTFLNPSQMAREFGVKVKLNIIKERVKGKRVVVVDDSIVRGHHGAVARDEPAQRRREGSPHPHLVSAAPFPPATTASISRTRRT